MDSLPPEYSALAAAELVERISARKRQLGKGLCILGHHYQCDDVIQFADLSGDSLKLSRLAAGQHEARYIVFCGVHFMAESAEVLSAPHQMILLPHLRAGCAMAEMADAAAVAAALEEVGDLAGCKILPIAYVNSTAAVKAVTGRAGGACCTSSNVRGVFEWAFRPGHAGGAGAEKIFAIPDQHLGRNTAVAMGFSEEDCVVYDPSRPDGGLLARQVRAAKFVLWAGCCYVHQVFRPEHVAAMREKYAGIRVIVHPECPREVAAAADAIGSTEQIIRAVADAPGGSLWAIGTEYNLVNRLAHQYPDKDIHLLSEGAAQARCVEMSRIDLPHLLWILDGIAAHVADGKSASNRITVPPDIAQDARLALQRMIDIKANTDPATSDN